MSESLTDDGRYRLLVDAITDYAIYMLDPNGVVSSWNPGAERFKGYQAPEILGRNFSTFYTPEDRAAGVPQEALRTAREVGRFEREGWRVRKDGTRMWAHVIIDAIRDDKGRVIGFAKITRDITERREAQLALEQAQQALFQSQKLESIGQLTGGVAHDFNNLLMAIMGSLELMRKRLPDDPKLKALLENAMLGATRGAALTQRMLAFARRQELQREAVSLPGLVEGMRDLMERSIGPTIHIASEIARSTPVVESDPNQLESALLNLVVNARDAMPNGGRITLATEPVSIGPDHPIHLPPGAYVRLSVRDTGQGMDAATLARATEPFFTTKGIGKGTGLGLSMVHGLAEQCGGRLTLDSTLGAGTVVSLWLPVAAEGMRADELSAARPGRAPTPVEKGRIVLAVDDDRLVLMNTAAMLEDLGHRAIEANSGVEALAAIEREPGIDLVISDQAMPGMTGVQLAEAIAERRPDLPVILATGYAELPPTAHAWRRLAKPFTQDQLAEAMDTALASVPPSEGAAKAV